MPNPMPLTLPEVLWLVAIVIVLTPVIHAALTRKGKS